MTPEQIVLVEETLASIDGRSLASDFYRRAFALDGSVAAMFTSDPDRQRARFGAELAEIVRTIRSLDDFGARVRALGVRHRGYGVHAAHYRVMGDALLAALADALGQRWTPEVEQAWQLAYNLTAETMMLGAIENSPTR